MINMKINMYRTPVTDEMKHCKMTRWITKCVKFKTASSSCEDTCEAQSLCLKHGSAAVKQQSEAAQETAVRSSTGNSSQKQHRKQKKWSQTEIHMQHLPWQMFPLLTKNNGLRCGLFFVQGHQVNDLNKRQRVVNTATHDTQSNPSYTWHTKQYKIHKAHIMHMATHDTQSNTSYTWQHMTHKAIQNTQGTHHTHGNTRHKRQHIITWQHIAIQNTQGTHHTHGNTRHMATPDTWQHWTHKATHHTHGNTWHARQHIHMTHKATD